ncbi:MAG: HAMP domain-containing protein [Candidatus Anammoxibacter sp.]
MEKSTRTYKRKQYFIQKDFQTKFILRFLGIALIASIASAFAFYFFVANDISASFSKAHMQIRNTWQIFLPALIMIGSLTFIISAAISTFMMIRFSHKIAGPLFRLEQIAKQIGEGNLDINVKLREEDQILPLAESFGKMAKGMNDRMYEIRESAENLDKAANKLLQLKGKAQNGEFDAAIKKVQENQQSLMGSISSFKIRQK